jgi:Spy/CpxP family protein refolding chaperone
MKKILIGICALLVLAAVALAQHHPDGGPHGKMKMRGEHGKMRGDMMEAHFAALGLTEDQKASAKQLHEELRAKAEPLMERLHEQHEQLQTLLEGANPDPATVGRQVITAHQTKAQLQALHEDFKTRFAALLTDEQKEKLEQFHERHGDGERRHGGPGFFHGHGF